MAPLTIVKIGGEVLDHPRKRELFLQQFAALPGAKVLVHGGGKIATEIGARLGIEAQYHNGRRITDAATLELVTMVYGGLINKMIVVQLQTLGCNAIGLSGADGDLIRADKRPVKEVDFGFVGDVQAMGVNTGLAGSLLDAGLVPVLAPLTHNGAGSLLNTNADTIAQEVAKAMTGAFEVQLIYCFGKPGVLLDATDDTSVVSSMNEDSFRGLLARGAITDGMIPKLENAFAAIRKGVQKVIIGDAGNLMALIHNQSGTLIQ